MQDAQQSGNYCFVLDGSSFELLRIHNPALLDRCIHRAKVFARMSPEHKQHLIECLQKLGWISKSFSFGLLFTGKVEILFFVNLNSQSTSCDGWRRLQWLRRSSHSGRWNFSFHGRRFRRCSIHFTRWNYRINIFSLLFLDWINILILVKI